MQGVGPATASLILSACNADVPYMGDEALEAQSRQKAREYTLKRYLDLASALRAKAETLSGQGDGACQYSVTA